VSAQAVGGGGKHPVRKLEGKAQLSASCATYFHFQCQQLPLDALSCDCYQVSQQPVVDVELHGSELSQQSDGPRP
jgi:hypothetical protein